LTEFAYEVILPNALALEPIVMVIHRLLDDETILMNVNAPQRDSRIKPRAIDFA